MIETSVEEDIASENGAPSFGAIPINTIRVLLVDDNPADALFIGQMLRQPSADPIECVAVSNLSQALARIDRGGIDLILLDLTLPDSHGLDTFGQVHEAAPDTPIIVLSGLDDNTLAVGAVRRGAQDYLVKGSVTSSLLRRSLRYGLERHRQMTVLREMSLIDPLTGLYNRRGFHALADGHIMMARRRQRRFSIVCADLDGLKVINDTRGHKEGDSAIVHTAEILKTCFRQSDLVARFGGDEFVVLALDTEADSNGLIERRITHALERFNREAGLGYPLSFSVGIVQFEVESSQPLDDMIAQADEELYRNKPNSRVA